MEKIESTNEQITSNIIESEIKKIYQWIKVQDHMASQANSKEKLKKS